MTKSPISLSKSKLFKDLTVSTCFAISLGSAVLVSQPSFAASSYKDVAGYEDSSLRSAFLSPSSSTTGTSESGPVPTKSLDLAAQAKAKYLAIESLENDLGLRDLSRDRNATQSQYREKRGFSVGNLFKLGGSTASDKEKLQTEYSAKETAKSNLNSRMSEIEKSPVDSVKLKQLNQFKKEFASLESSYNKELRARATEETFKDRYQNAQSNKFFSKSKVKPSENEIQQKMASFRNSDAAVLKQPQYDSRIEFDLGVHLTNADSVQQKARAKAVAENHANAGSTLASAALKVKSNVAKDVATHEKNIVDQRKAFEKDENSLLKASNGYLSEIDAENARQEGITKSHVKWQEEQAKAQDNKLKGSDLYKAAQKVKANIAKDNEVRTASLVKAYNAEAKSHLNMLNAMNEVNEKGFLTSKLRKNEAKKVDTGVAAQRAQMVQDEKDTLQGHYGHALAIQEDNAQAAQTQYNKKVLAQLYTESEKKDKGTLTGDLFADNTPAGYYTPGLVKGEAKGYTIKELANEKTARNKVAAVNQPIAGKALRVAANQVKTNVTNDQLATQEARRQQEQAFQIDEYSALSGHFGHASAIQQEAYKEAARKNIAKLAANGYDIQNHRARSASNPLLGNLFESNTVQADLKEYTIRELAEEKAALAAAKASVKKGTGRSRTVFDQQVEVADAARMIVPGVDTEVAQVGEAESLIPAAYSIDVSSSPKVVRFNSSIDSTDSEGSSPSSASSSGSSSGSRSAR